MPTKIILKSAVAFFFLFFLHRTSIRNGQQGISYNSEIDASMDETIILILIILVCIVLYLIIAAIAWHLDKSIGYDILFEYYSQDARGAEYCYMILKKGDKLFEQESIRQAGEDKHHFDPTETTLERLKHKLANDRTYGIEPFNLINFRDKINEVLNEQ